MPTFSTAGEDGTPLYSRIARVLRERISGCEWPVGTQIPTIDTLMAEFGVARATIREALQQLAKEGLIASYRGRGTLVLDHTPEAKSVNRLVISDPQVDIDLREMVRLDQLPARIAGDYSLDSRYLLVRKIHRRDGLPVATTEIYVCDELSGGISRQDVERRTLLSLVGEHVFVDGIEFRHRLTVGAADLQVADQLECALGDPVVRVERACVRLADNRLLYSAHSAYPGSSYELNFSGDARQVIGIDSAWLDAGFLARLNRTSGPD